MHEPSRDLGPSDIWVLTHIIFVAQLTWPIDASDHRGPMSPSDVNLSKADVRGLANTIFS